MNITLNMKKLILPVSIFTFGFAPATHAQQVNTLLTKQLPEAPGKEILYPVATVILGGLISSTLLDMAVTPAVFYLFGEKGYHEYLRARSVVNQNQTGSP